MATYSTAATSDINLTFDYQAIRDAVALHSPNGYTAVGLGIESGQSTVMDPAYTRTFANKTIVVMTDGIHNTGVEPEVSAAAAHNDDNITVHTITFSEGADQDHMAIVAGDGGGSHWHANDQASLLQVFEDVANNLPTLITE